MQSPAKGAQAASSPKSADTTGGGAPEIPPQIPPMYSPAQMRQLKVAVIAMGVILLLGFAVVIGRIVYLVNSGPKPVVAAAVPVGGQGGTSPGQSPVLPTPLSQAGASISLPRGAVIRQMAISGNRLALYYEGPDGAGVRIVDLSSGGPGLTLPIVPEVERRP